MLNLKFTLCVIFVYFFPALSLLWCRHVWNLAFSGQSCKFLPLYLGIWGRWCRKLTGRGKETFLQILIDRRTGRVEGWGMDFDWMEGIELDNFDWLRGTVG